MRDRRRPRPGRTARRDPGVRPRRDPAGGAGRRARLLVAVPEAPDAPPVELRPARVAEKQRAGAQLCVLNHVAARRGWPTFVAAAGPPARRCRSSPRSPSTPTSAPPGCCSASPAWTWTRGGRAGARRRRTRVAAGYRGRGRRGAGAAGRPRRGRGEPVRAGSARGAETAPRSRPRSPTSSGRRRDRAESEAMEAEFDTVAGWTEEAVSRSARSTRSRPAAGAAAARARCAGWPTRCASRRATGCSTPAPGSAARPAGWPPSAGCARSAPSRWRPPCTPAGRCSGCPRGRARPGAAVRRRLRSTRPGAWASCAPPRRRRRAGRAAPGAGRRRPARPAGLRRRRAAAPAAARGQQFPPRPRCAAAPGPASRHRRRRGPGRQPTRMEGAGRRRRRRGGARGTATIPAVGEAQEQGGSAGCSPPARCGPGWRLRRPLVRPSGAKKHLAKNSLPLLRYDHARRRDPAGTRRPGDGRPGPPRAGPSAPQPPARAAADGRALRPPPGSPRRLGESSGSTSYHLRRLAAFGFVEEVPGQSPGRERWWRALHRSTRWQAAEILAPGGRCARSQDELHPHAARPARRRPRRLARRSRTRARSGVDGGGLAERPRDCGCAPSRRARWPTSSTPSSTAG